jgi:hypothetical protein
MLLAGAIINAPEASASAAIRSTGTIRFTDNAAGSEALRSRRT